MNGSRNVPPGLIAGIGGGMSQIGGGLMGGDALTGISSWTYSFVMSTM